jgi:rhodanese-related sulfurtransferase
MKTKYFIFTLFGIIFLFFGIRIYAQSSSIDVSKFNEFQKIGYKVIDVRTPAEYAIEHISGAMNINFLEPDFALNLDKLDKQANYILYDKAGTRSTKAAKIMLDKGFINVYYLEGGLDAWKEENRPVEKNQHE